MTAAIDKLLAILRRDLLTAVRHRMGFAISFVGVLTQLAAFFFLSRAIGPAFRPGGVEYFPFLMVGTGLYTFFVMSAQSFVGMVQEAQQTGTMEVLMTTSTAPAELVVLSSISAFAGNLGSLVAYLLIGIGVFRAPVQANVLACLLVVLLSVAIALAIGIAAATLQVAFQKGSALVWLLGSGLWFLSGAMFPVESLPHVLQTLARVTPFVYAVSAMRGALLEGRTLGELGARLAALSAFILFLVPLSLWGLSWSLRRARQNGTLSFY
jgi:ABC-2 type transport system permease protein